ncbi:FUSC family protein [Helicobacter cappadocius]|uniref:FUSC family protein n=1 Tax=Helicobacter cappadocius TaxID=3063998 RepID=A0AA90PR02_9HELI|nr:MULTISPECIES: FUSC family protein [unclassified Helicobacter]MDO7252675.1 FUSC family protein [Helicobacter sp. faydin-H75]MDP2538542.1 FUSC family protein [Helicobacter sp. faydin-H76]
MKNHFLRYVYVYDPGYFSLIYSLKTLIAVFLSIVINYFLFGSSILVWAALSPIYIYFLNTLIGDKNKIRHLTLFILLSCLAVFIFSIFSALGLWLFLPVVLMAFIVGISSVYSIDLQKVLNMVLINGLVACIYVNSNIPIMLEDEILTIFIGGFIGILMLFFISIGKYGKFTKKNFPSLLFDLELMIGNISNSKDYFKIRNQTLLQIESIKHILNSRAGKIKDPHIIKNTKRTLFYLYRIEEIYHSINSIHYYFNTNKIDDLFYQIKDEIVMNLRELSKMFYGSRPNLSREILQRVLLSDCNKVFVSSVKIIYNKIESFRRGGEEEAYLAQAMPSKKFKDILDSITDLSPVCRYSIKYSLTLGATIFIAQFLKIDHGIWIAIGAMAIMRPNLGSIKDISKDYFLGTFVGLFCGIVFVSLFERTFVFYPLFIIVLFLFIYFRVYPYAIWSGVMMVAFVMMFSMLREDFLELIFGRLLDILIAFCVVFGAFWFIWPKYSGDDVMPSIKENITFLQKLLALIDKNLENLSVKKREFINLESGFFNQYNLLSASINDAKEEKNTYSKKDIANAQKALESIDSLNQSTNKLYDYLCHFENLNENKEIFNNDVKLVLTRYEMLIKLIDGLPYYFKEEKDGRFLATDDKFNMMIEDIFILQNQLYLATLSNMKY